MATLLHVLNGRDLPERGDQILNVSICAWGDQAIIRFASGKTIKVALIPIVQPEVGDGNKEPAPESFGNGERFDRPLPNIGRDGCFYATPPSSGVDKVVDVTPLQRARAEIALKQRELDLLQKAAKVFEALDGDSIHALSELLR